MSNALKDRLVKLGAAKPSLRSHIRPILAELSRQATVGTDMLREPSSTQVLENIHILAQPTERHPGHAKIQYTFLTHFKLGGTKAITIRDDLKLPGSFSRYSYMEPVVISVHKHDRRNKAIVLKATSADIGTQFATFALDDRAILKKLVDWK